MFVELLYKFVNIAHSISIIAIRRIRSLQELKKIKKTWTWFELKWGGDRELSTKMKCRLEVLTIIVFSSVMCVSHSKAPPGVAARLFCFILFYFIPEKIRLIEKCIKAYCRNPNQSDCINIVFTSAHILHKHAKQNAPSLVSEVPHRVLETTFLYRASHREGQTLYVGGLGGVFGAVISHYVLQPVCTPLHGFCAVQ